MSASDSPTSCSDPLAQARQLQIRVRSDLKITRQVSQGEAVYVAQDPVTFRSHRLTIFQYHVLAALVNDRPLGEQFPQFVQRGHFADTEEQDFYSLVNSLLQTGLIRTAAVNGSRLYEQNERIRSAKRRGKLMGFLFLQVPLVNPDGFLTRTVHLVSWLFTKSFLGVWLLMMLAAGFVIHSRLEDFVEPLNGLLATENLPFLWAAFVLLKIWHELGHGYACKVFGGFVPEMGTILIAGTPAAYVNASAAWSFPERHRRLVVMCGGMFFESLVFIPCVFVWAFAANPMLASCAYQLLVMASMVTLLFNANPLMKFDGYFILSELIGIQNLRPKADAMIKRILTTYVVGVRHSPAQHTAGTAVALVTYGVAAAIYKFFLVISIAMMVAMKFPMVGLGLAVFHVGTTVGFGLKKLFGYLLSAKETAPVRWRARLVAAAIVPGFRWQHACFPLRSVSPFRVLSRQSRRNSSTSIRRAFFSTHS